MAKLPDMLSVSQMNRFMSCPLSYRFKYVDGIETGLKSSSLALGTAFHSAAERLHQDIMKGTIDKAEAYCEVCAFALDVEFTGYDVAMKPGEDEQTLKTVGRGLVGVYYDHRLASPAKILACEQKLQCNLIDHETGEELAIPFIGYLDLIEESPDGDVIVDLKTACRSYNQADVDESIQITAYALMLAQENGHLPHCRIDAIIRNKQPKVQSLQTTRNADHFRRFFHLAKAVRRSILQASEADCFFPNRGWMCSTCEFAAYCNEWRG